MNPKYQIFISSTYEDLKDEREQVIKSILRLGHIPIGMEMFNAADQTQWELIKRRIEESDYYIVIVAQRYGSTIKEENGISYTEKEYDYARSLGIPTYGFVLAKDAPWPGNKRDEGENAIQKQASLQLFIEKIQRTMRAPWSNRDELATAVTLSLNENIAAFPRTGWVRANQVLAPETANEIARLSKENADLREQITFLQNANRAAPMPEISMDLQLVEGEEDWFVLPPKALVPGYGSFDVGLGQAERQARVGRWLRVKVRNDGTLATSFTLIMSSDALLIAPNDLEAFQKKDRFGFPSREDGWWKVEYESGSQKWSFSGGGNSLKPGQDLEFVAPIHSTLLNSAATDSVVEVNLHPTTGNHIHQAYTLEKLTNAGKL